MKYLIIILVSFIPILSFGQGDNCDFSVSGKVLDAETKNPIPFVSVKIKDHNRSTHTDENGDFLIDKLCDEVNTIVITCLGYCDSICTHPHHHEEIPHIYLTQKIEKLGTVLIEAEKGPEQGTKALAQVQLKKADLQKDLTQSLASAISQKEGVNMLSTGTNVQLPVIHGLYGNRILILNNGLIHGFQNWGSEHAPEINPSSINNITIVKGSAGVRFGPEAIGGAIIVESSNMRYKNPLTIDLGSGYQSNGKGYYSNLEINHGLKNFGYFVNGNFTKIGDRHSPNYMLTNTGKQEQSLTAGTRFRHKKLDIKLLYSLVDQELALLRSSIAESANAILIAFNSDEPRIINPFSYDINEPNHTTQHHLGKIEAKWWYADDSHLTFRYGRQLNKRQEFDVRRNSHLPIIDLNLYTSDYQLEWHHPHWMDLEGLVGLQYFYQSSLNNPGTGVTPIIPNYKTHRLSTFIIENKKINNNTIEGGLRFDYVDNSIAGRETNQNVFRDDFSFSNVTASIGLIKNFNSSLVYRTNLASSWRTPNMLELYSFGQHGFQTSFGMLRYYTNDEGQVRTDRVTPISESGIKVESGYKFTNEFEIQKEKDRLVLTAFAQVIENYIYDRPLGLISTFRGPMPIFIYNQVDAAFIGADLTWNRDWNSKISGKLGMSYLWAQDIERNSALINQPPIRFSYSLEWESKEVWKLNSLKLEVNPSYTLQQFQAPRTITPDELFTGQQILSPDSELFDFMDAPEAFFLLQAGISAKLNAWQVGIKVQNALNERYRDYLNNMRYFANEPGRNILLNVKYQFKTKSSETTHS